MLQRARSASVLAILGLSAACSAATEPDDPAGSGGGGDLGTSGVGGAHALGSLSGAPGISLAEVALYQGIKRPLVTAGQPAASTIPIVAGRDALVRVFVQNDGSFTGALTGRLVLGESDPIEVTATLSDDSNDAHLDTTLNFELPGDLLQPELTYRLEIGTLDGGSKDSPAIAYPAEGAEPLPVTPDGDLLKIVIVPVRYDADGSGRLPDTGDAQMTLYEGGFGAMYPVPHVQITVHPEMPWSEPVGPSGTGWNALLGAVEDLRASDGAPPDVYYYGAFAPAETELSFCGGSCIAGLALTSSTMDGFGRAAIGLGFSGYGTVATALHEIGHSHGRKHSPCETADPDPAYPHAEGSDGVWGYDRARDLLFGPNVSDIMGYCKPAWISDWTFVALFDRIRAVNGLANAYVIGGPDHAGGARAYDRARIDPDGGVHRLSPIALYAAPRAEPRVLELESHHARTTVMAQFIGYDHLPGGILLWEHAPDAEAAAFVDEAGRPIRIVLSKEPTR